MSGVGASIPATAFPYKSISASTLIKTGQGKCILVLITSSSSLVIRLYDNTSAAGTVIVASMSVSAKEAYDVPALFETGLYVEFVSGSGSLTVFYV